MGVRVGLIAGIVVLSLMIAGCGRSKPPFPRETRKMSPVTGMIKVDGKPAAGISVYLVPADKVIDSTIPADFGFETSGVTNAEGKFEINTGTSEQKVGAPVGNYVVVFQNRFGGDNVLKTPQTIAAKRFNEKYSNSAKSDRKVPVEEGKPVDLGVIELTTN